MKATPYQAAINKSLTATANKIRRALVAKGYPNATAERVNSMVLVDLCEDKFWRGKYYRLNEAESYLATL